MALICDLPIVIFVFNTLALSIKVYSIALVWSLRQWRELRRPGLLQEPHSSFDYVTLHTPYQKIRFWSTFWWPLGYNRVITGSPFNWHCITLLIDRVTNIVRCTCLAFQSIIFKTFLNKSLSSPSNVLQGFRQALSISKVTDFRLALRQPCCILLWTESYLLFAIHLLKCCGYH